MREYSNTHPDINSKKKKMCIRKTFFVFHSIFGSQANKKCYQSFPVQIKKYPPK